MSKTNNLIDRLTAIKHQLNSQYNKGTINEACAILAKVERGELAEVVRCGECAYYHKAHVLCNDGTEKDISEFPEEVYGFADTFVTIEYGITVGGKCELEKNCGYAEDKSVFRNPNDFCSRGERSGEK